MRSFFYEQPWGLLSAAVLAVLYLLAALPLLWALQLENYRPRKMLPAVRRISRGYLPALLGLSVLCAGLLLLPEYGIGASFLVMLAGHLGLLIGDAKRSKKTPLKFTARLKRLAAACWLWMFAAGALFRPAQSCLFCLLPLFVWLGWLVTRPLEGLIAARYLAACRKKLEAAPHLIRIGITGSAGKTTAKHILTAMLAPKFRVLATPKSFNTPLGVTRCVLGADLNEYDVFLAEMGARRRGDILALCRLVRPTVGVLTAVLPQHLESFGDLQTVTAAKFELLDFLEEEEGSLAVNGEDPNIAAELSRRQSARVIASGEGGEVFAREVRVGPEGLSFQLCFAEGECFDCRTQLLGAHNLGNILLCALVARRLGVSPAEIAAAVRELQPVPHRLQLLKAVNCLILDDSYNANAEGAAQALKTLSALPGTRFVVTPGQVEGGESQEGQNRTLGGEAALCCDFCLFVGGNAPALKRGALAAGMPGERVLTFGSLSEASRALAALMKDSPQNAVLFENDLPDNY